MKKRIISILLSLVMLFALLPTAAFAASFNVNANYNTSTYTAAPTWDAVSGADYYVVYLDNQHKNGSWSQVNTNRHVDATDPLTTTFSPTYFSQRDTNEETDQYLIRVYAYNKLNMKLAESESAPFKLTMPTLVNPTVSLDPSTGVATWSKVANANNYSVGLYVKGDSTRLAYLTTGNLKFDFSDNMLEGYEFRVSVQALNSSGNYRASETVYSSWVKYTGFTSTTPQAAPVITAQPKAVTVKEGESTTFSVTATGEGLSYQWYSADASKNTKITGATSASYTISKVATSQNGLSYYCVVTNAAGSVTSNKAKLTVNASAKTITHLGFSFDVPNDGEEYPDGAKDIGRVTKCPEGVKVVDVETVQYSKRINGTAKAGDLVSFGIIYEVLPGYEIASSYTASINGESAQKVVTGTGVRKVSFKNGATIGYNPDITIQSDLPDTVSYTVGGNIEAKVSATGSNLKYQWQLATDSGKKFNTYKDISGATSASLSIKNADESYDGKLLRCCVSNSNGNAYSKIATLKKVAANTVTAADVTIPAPAAGQKASTYTSWTTDAPEKYTIVGGEWLKGTGLNGAAMGANETFAAGQKYTAVLTISLKSGYTMADSFAVKVNGNSEVNHLSSSMNIWYYTFTCPDSGAITAAEVTIPTPAAGQKATTYKSWTTDVPEKYTVSGGMWTKGTDPDGIEMGENETFVAGQKYTAVFVVATKPGYTLADNFAATVNGNSAVLYDSANLHLWYYTFTCPAAGAPVITAQPKAVSIKAGESATFTVTATGEKLTYQWYAVDGGVPTKFATTATCTVKNVPLGYNGLNFYCVVTNDNGSVTSEQAKLTVLDPTPVTPVDTYVFPFTDVLEKDWFYKDVYNANKMGLINGKTATLYKPNDNMTYAEAIKLAACMNQYYNDGEVTLTNGSPNWYDSYVEYARTHGIPWDYEDYNAKITRRDYVHIFYYALPKENYKAINNITAIPDVKSDDKYASEILAFYNAGILTGSDAKGTFNPSSNIKRSEVAAILSRMMDATTRKMFELK